MEAQMTKGSTVLLAEFCACLDRQDQPPEVRQRVRQLLLDYLGVALRGSRSPSGRIATKVALELGGPGPSTVLGTSQCTRPEWAALANGTSGHSIELDDVTQESSTHPGVAVIPAVLALAEARPDLADGWQAGMLAGYEVHMRLGEAFDAGEQYRAGFHTTGTCGAFGAAVATAVMRGLGPEGVSAAMGVVGGMASGSMEYLTHGTWTKRLNPGWAAHSGLVASALAAAGYQAPLTAIEGPFGFLHAYGRSPRPEAVTANLGSGLKLMETSVKLHACCRYMHASIDCALDLRSQLDGRLEQIQSIRAGVLSAGYEVVGAPIEAKRRPRNVVDAQFSIPFGIAVALVLGTTRLDAFTDEMLADPRVRALMGRIDTYTSEWIDEPYPREWRGDLEVTLRDGTMLKAQIGQPRGTADDPGAAAEVETKFREMVAPLFSDSSATALIAAVDHGDGSGILEVCRMARQPELVEMGR